MKIIRRGMIAAAALFLLTTCTDDTADGTTDDATEDQVFTGPGTCSMFPRTMTVDRNEQFTTEIYVDTGSQNVAAYSVDALFDEAIIAVDTTLGSSGVSPGLDGFVSAVNANCSGVLQLNGFDVSGKAPGANLHLVTIHWTAVGTGTTKILLEVEVLADSACAVIGVPAGNSSSVTVN